MRVPSPAADSFERGGPGLLSWTRASRACSGKAFAEGVLRISIAVSAQMGTGIRGPGSGIRLEARSWKLETGTDRRPALTRNRPQCAAGSPAAFQRAPDNRRTACLWRALAAQP